MALSSSTSDLIRSIESALGISLDSSSSASVVVLTTSLAVIVGLVWILWKRSNDGSGNSKVVVAPKPLKVQPEEDELELAAGKTKVTIFFGTQTGTAEGFAKVISVENSLRLMSYGLFLLCLSFCLVDLIEVGQI